MLSFDIKVTGPAGEALRKVAEKLTNLRPLLEGYGAKLVSNFRRNIDESRMPSGARFPPLKRPRGRGHNPDPKPLIDTGALYQDIQSTVEMPDTVRAGNTLEYAVYQNKGTRHLPLRTYIGVSDSDLNVLKSDAHAFVVTAFEVGPTSV